MPEPWASLASRVEAHLERIDDERHRMLESIFSPDEIDLETGEDLAVATAAVTDAAEEIRTQLAGCNLSPTQTIHPDRRSEDA